MEHGCVWFTATGEEQLNSLPSAPAAHNPRLQPDSHPALLLGQLLCIPTAAAAHCHQPWWHVYAKPISLQQQHSHGSVAEPLPARYLTQRQQYYQQHALWSLAKPTTPAAVAQLLDRQPASQLH